MRPFEGAAVSSLASQANPLRPYRSHQPNIEQAIFDLGTRYGERSGRAARHGDAQLSQADYRGYVT